MINYNTLLNKIEFWGKKVGRATTRPVLLLWFVMCSSKTSQKDKLAILASIAYLIFPIDILDEKRLPIVGWLDEIMAVSIAIKKMSKYITSEMLQKTEDILNEWFPENDFTILSPDTNIIRNKCCE